MGAFRSPSLHARVIRMLDDGAYPSNTFTSTGIGNPIRFALSLRNAMPKSSLFSLTDWITATPDPLTFVTGLRCDEISMKLAVNEVAVFLPNSMSVRKFNKRGEPIKFTAHSHPLSAASGKG